jgi:SpoVK/Ycf46/Vps4 family AAA+-type ATPase
MIQKTPILDESLMTKIENATVMFSKKTAWKNLGMDKLREQGAAMLFYGPPGTGKTITARWLAQKLKRKILEMDFSMIGSDTPGELGRNIKKLFNQAIQPDIHDNPSLVFLDECDTMLVARSRLGHSSLWMLEPINALLREIGTYPGLVVLATNQEPEFLDFALERRLIGKFYFGAPDYLTRVKLWQSKWPRKLPLKLNNGDAEGLAQHALTGAGIENTIVEWVSDVLRQDKMFKFEDLHDVAHARTIASSR